MTSPIQRHVISLCRRGFAELLGGRPYLVWKDLGQQSGDILVVRELDSCQKRPTGAVAIFQLPWVSRPGDDNGELSGLLAPQAVILGLTPANVLIASRELGLVAEPATPSPAPVPVRARSSSRLTPWPPAWAPPPGAPPNADHRQAS